MCLSPSDVASVEKWANKYAHYCNVASAQGAILRKEPERFRAAYKTVADRWRVQSVAAGQRDDFMARMEDNCLKEPQNFTDRVEIVFSASSMMQAIGIWILADKSDQFRTQFYKRQNEISEELMIQGEIPPQPKSISPSVPTRRLHSSEVDEFKRDPSLLLGKNLLHLVVAGDSKLKRPYEVVEFGVTIEVGKWFRVSYEDTRELNRLDAEEMDDWLENSHIVDYDLV
ncbi:hypothetical protein BS47DRAFT_1034757 [Hydnum rufescens UP504]|uniref:Uncharacterized protein n=1 Tax=Hydnum rufescens UP504 TaxID=1448309 RepID=A0A9P6DWH7_9AGAM|nr:hypothetical protein BS47DRAFT_1034757 [Hydnum rufescens UP504]